MSAIEYEVAGPVAQLTLNRPQRGNGITDSPLVDKSSAASVRLGYLYKF